MSKSGDSVSSRSLVSPGPMPADIVASCELAGPPDSPGPTPATAPPTVRPDQSQEVRGDAGHSVRPQAAAAEDDDIRGGAVAAPGPEQLTHTTPRLQVCRRDRPPRLRHQGQNMLFWSGCGRA